MSMADFENIIISVNLDIVQFVKSSCIHSLTISATVKPGHITQNEPMKG